MTTHLRGPGSLAASLIIIAIATAIASLLSTGMLGIAIGSAHASPTQTDPDARPWSWPLEPTPAVISRFDPPELAWGSGHRGIDLTGASGQAVHAVADGVVSYAGMLAGRGVVVVSHGTIRSTYEPLTAVVRRGDRVTQGQIIGFLQGLQSHCLPATCLHLGARIGEAYIDPETLLGLAEIRLKPLDGVGPARPPLLMPL